MPIFDAFPRVGIPRALVQSVVRQEATEGHVSPAIAAHPEVLDENLFLATRQQIAVA